MGIGRFLNHSVSIIRRTGNASDDYGQPITVETVLAAGVAAGIQPKTAREIAAVHQAGAAVSTHTVFILPRDITASDFVLHEQATCGAANDLEDGRYEVVGVPDAAGAGHHLELDCRLIASEAVAAPAGS